MRVNGFRPKVRGSAIETMACNSGPIDWCARHSTNRERFEKYLASGMDQGHWAVYAKKMVQKFGDEVFDIIEHASARLETIEGIGPGRRKLIKDAWQEQKVIRDIMVFCTPME